ncbi:hypothetical protein [Comamonas sp. MYb396]|uniref:hypothetical protein n=1 Tax=Comamonas sp. MYb396 TaxID=2745302 RepID=UPI0030AED1CB
MMTKTCPPKSGQRFARPATVLCAYAQAAPRHRPGLQKRKWGCALHQKQSTTAAQHLIKIDFLLHPLYQSMYLKD